MHETLTMKSATGTTSPDAGSVPPTDFVQVVARRAAVHPDKIAYTFLRDGEVAVASLTYAELDRRARAIAAELAAVAAPGDRALLLFPDGLDFILGFLGCLYAGVVAVPVYPPHARAEYWQRLEGLASDCQAAHLLCMRDYLPELDRHTAGLPSLGECRRTVIDLADGAAGEGRAVCATPDSVAFLQYTSGSTSLPKGVVVTHRCLMDNMRLMEDAFGHHADSVFVSWLPLFHDMGLIGNVLQSLYVGGHCCVMAPAAFIQNPMRWLRAISTYRGTSAFAPNFAYELCAQRGSAGELAELDLSCWGMALNGAEPVRYETLRRFADKYAQCGFDERALYPAYGLAEATLFVSGGGRGTGVTCFDADAELLDRAGLVRAAPQGTPARRLVSSGRAWQGTRLRIVNAQDGTCCADGIIGEIWVGNDSVANGYWGREAETDRAFRATPAGEEGRYLRTGDLGFLHEGHLYVTGRVKELIILRGANYYPHDIERVVQDAVPGLKLGGGAAVSVDVDGAEQLVVVQEIDRTHIRKLDPEAVFVQVRQAILRSHGVAPYAVVLIRPATLPKTSSGKIQRQLVRARFLDGSLGAIAVAERRWPLSALAQADADLAQAEGPQDWTGFLRALVARQLQVHADEVAADASPVELGLDSLAVATIQYAVQSASGVALPMASLLGNVSLGELGRRIAADAAERTDAAAPHAVGETDTPAAWPLSENQRQLWLLQARAPDSSAYHVPVCLQGTFAPAALRGALTELLARHAILRTACFDDNGVPSQRLVDDAALPLREVQCDDDTLEERMVAECRRPFDLARGEPCRVTHYRSASGPEHLLFVFHHIAVDLRSVQCLLAEFGDLYQTAAGGLAFAPAPVRPDYRAFVGAQRLHARGGEGRRALAFWRERLGRTLPVLQLPTDRNRPAVQSFAGTSLDFSLDQQLSRQLRLLAKRHGVTVNTLLLSAWQLLLGRAAGQSEIVTGVPMAGRHLPGFEQTVGYFVEPAVVAAAWRPETPFAELAQAIQAELAAALDHQGGVLDALQGYSARQAGSSVPPVFQNLYTFYPQAMDGLLPFNGTGAPMPVRAGALACALRPLPSPGAQLDLAMLVAETRDCYHCRIEYNTDLFDAGTAGRFANRYRRLLTELAEHPAATAGAVDLLDPAERTLALRSWNDTAVAYGEARTLHAIIDARALAHPDAPAARCAGESLSYAALRARSDALAALLVSRGVGPGTCVGVYMRRSLPLLVSLLGILKAGAAYVPVDPDYPQERVADIIGTGLGTVLTSRALHDELAPFGVQAICVDELAAAAPAGWRAPQVDDEDLAYVIFTSGSTGRPKGVMNTHGAIRNRLLWMQELGQLRQGEHVLQKTPFSFDVSVWEFFWPLMVGAVVVFARPGGHLEADYLNALVEEEEIGTLHFVPSMLQAFLEQDGPALPSLRQVFCSGEELPADLVRRFFDRYPGIALHNLYGPTEAAVDVSHRRCDAADTGRRIPIGRPIANTQLYVLDAALQPVGIGIVGELYIGGVGLARGYLGRADLTAERFVPDPFALQGGARLYRTGDLARWRADGAIEYLGRTDHQVKLRGLRIELGEVEAALVRLDGVREAVAAVRGEGADKALVAYVTGEGLEPAQLRQALTQRLPAYMVPSALAVLEALPLSPNGKVDRRALPPIALAGEDHARRLPQTPREQTLAVAWREVLGLETVGLDEDFFALGGHSLLAARLVARLRGDGLALSVRDVFEAPTIAAQALRAAGLADEGPAPVRVARGIDAPLSYAQQRLWFLAQLEGVDATYNMPHAVRLVGALDAAALRTAILGLVERHEVLRSVYSVRDNEPRQIVRPLEDFVVGWDDWSGQAHAQREAALAALVQADSARGFDLARELPLRVALIKLADDEHAMLLCLHHIAGDGWSVELLWRELEQGYEAALQGGTQPAAPALQYIDYAAWQRDWLAAGTAATQLAYWRQQLDGLPPLLELPLDHARPAVRRHAGASLPVAVPAQLLAPLRALGQAEQASLFMTLLAVFQLVLARYSGQDDIAVGSPVANRPRAELDGLIGFFANTLVLRNRVRREHSFRTLLAAVRETTLAAHEHQDLPFEQLVEVLQPARSLSYSPLFQVMFNLQHGAAETIALPQVAASVLPAANTVAKFDLTLTLQDRHGALSGTLEYDVDLFEQASVARLWRHYLAVLEHVLHTPDEALGTLDLLGADERAELAAWNANEVAYPVDACLHTLFERQAARTPDATALVCGEEALSYAELNARANGLALRLRALGVGAESRVGVCLPRTLDLVVSLLAVLKAGGAYVPLDATQPLARLRQIAGQAELTLAIGHSAEAAALAALDLTWLAPDEAGVEADPGWRAAPDQLAYLMFTSGSTGVPKGILTTHRGVVRLLVGSDFADFGPGRRVLHAAPLAFDASTFEIWGALLHGGCCVLYPNQVPTAPELGAFIARHGVDTAWLTSALFSQLVDEDVDCLRGLGQLLVGGDVVSAAHVQRVYRANAQLRITNGYGPTESTTFAACHPIARLAADAPISATVPIGAPIANTRLHVLDAAMQPVGVGITGELYIGGAGLARGYLGRADLTAERFVPDPFAQQPGERLYRTGDLVRWRADGALEYLGRTDHQVKLRGLRIELGEVEAALARLPGVREAVVVLRGEGADKALHGYVAGSGVDTASLRAGLERVLPAWMVPSALAVLDALPLTANGKVDRVALPAIGIERKGASSRAPRTPRERLLAAAWCEVLGLDAVGLDEQFFELGGHSLLAARLVARLRDAGLALRVRDVFEAPTVAGQAARLASLADAGPALVPMERGLDAPLSYAQQRLWFLAQLEGVDATYNMPHAVRLVGRLDPAALRTAVCHLVERHEVLRSVYAVRDGEPRQLVLPSDAFTLSCEDWSALAPEDREALLAERVQADSARGFDLARELPLRVALIKLADDEHAMLLCLHHIAGDGWSVELLWRELEQGYESALQGTTQPAAPALQYIDYAAWQRDWLAAGTAATQLAYWRQQLDGLPPLLELPLDHARPAVRRHAGASLPVAVPAQLLAPLRALGQAEQASLFMTLLAVFQLVLARYSGQDDIAVGSPVANRPRAELDGLIGFFANTLVLRNRVRREHSFRTLLAAVRETTLAAHEHQDLPFEQLVEVLQPARSLSYSPLFQVMFNLQHGAAETIALPQVAASVLPAANTVAKFDLTLTLQDRHGALSGTLEYDVDLFEQASVARLWRHYLAVLEHVLHTPDEALGALDLLGADERAELAAWNANEVAYPVDACLHTLFERQAARTPDATALVCGEEALSYAELNARANGLALRLRALGVGAESRVGVCLPRTLDLVVSLLAVLKAGGAYVPLDPNYPDGRLAHILENARPAVVLSDAAGSGRLPPLAPPGAVIHDATAVAASAIGPDVVPATLPGQLAYVIYTSGSTGKPKGVAITHANAVAMLGWAERSFGADALRFVLASTSICFDLSVFELFLPLATGHTVVLVRDALALVEAPPARPITLVNTVPSAMEALLAADALPTSVRVVNLAGEALGRGLVDRLHACAHVQDVYNLYGPSEDTTYSTGGAVERGSVQPPSIGKPLDNTRAYVLDAALRQVAPGALGELYLAGSGISRGYLGQPELTAERYLPNPFAASPGERMYRTGDLVRHLPDGRLAYLGRADQQIKLRGFRIELGEIESVLAAQIGVRAAAALVRPLGDGPESLVAFLQVDPSAKVTEAGLRRALAGLLPDYMIPTRIVALEALPLTQNGKIDRKALFSLPIEAAQRPDDDPPVSETEQRLAGLWSEVLGLKRVGRHEDFFAAGGHSLLATALSARVLAAFGVATAVRDIFLYPRLADQAERIDNLRWASAGAAKGGREQAAADDLDVGVL